ncbi:hypothetical protein [Spartinivicinus ruber]|uniref:hypothetical protein n=1 Tax=Spartinivicinus ruber TaxID=2683272 RepID=UPI0013D58914|nr:hypothetical protein [Spartinivicinus ruber]
MKFETSIKAIEREISRLEKKNQAIQSNIDEYFDYSSLEKNLMNKSFRQGELESAIRWHETKLKKLSPKLLQEHKAELVEVKKEMARIRKVWHLDITKESDKQFKIKDQIKELQSELFHLQIISSR